jgi:hypothetical protein
MGQRLKNRGGCFGSRSGGGYFGDSQAVRTRKLSGGPWPSAPAPGSPTPSRGRNPAFPREIRGVKKILERGLPSVRH